MKPPLTAHLDPADAAAVLARWHEVEEAMQRSELASEDAKELKQAVKKKAAAFRAYMRELGTPGMFDRNGEKA